ncbi:MAG TPA: protein phosphatase 2C domain-containing protein [Longimicrobiaceae bacterium]|nr:protein phosphatase 2C domain-containing protein [Longimicrobiaceae bacterium]
MSIRWEVAAATDVGRVRQGNEDTYLVDAARGLFLVADGMGGHAAGEIASALAAETVGSALVRGVDGGLDGDGLTQALTESFHSAHAAIGARCEEDPNTRGMGTTLIALAVSTTGAYLMGHVGDSRAYLMRGGRLGQVTRDHTWVQDEVDAGRLSSSGARTHRFAHVITRALGADSRATPDLVAGELLPGDLILLCTDGLTGMVSDVRLRRILSAEVRLEELVTALIDAANGRGGTDNITVVLVRILDGTS